MSDILEAQLGCRLFDHHPFDGIENQADVVS